MATSTSVEARRERGLSWRLWGPVVTGLLVALSSSLLSGPLHGQDGAADTEPARLTVTPIYRNLYPTGEVERVEEGTWGFDSSFGLGLRLGWRASDRLVVEAAAFRAPTDLSQTVGALKVVRGTDLDVVTGGASYYLGPAGWTVRPFLSAAAGVKRYAGNPPLDLEETRPTVAAGAGATVRTGGIVDVTVRFTDYISEFDPSVLNEEFEGTPLQNDLVLEMGLRIAVL